MVVVQRLNKIKGADESEDIEKREDLRFVVFIRPFSNGVPDFVVVEGIIDDG